MTAVSAPRPGWELLAGQVNQRRYEALRACLFEGASLQHAAGGILREEGFGRLLRGPAPEASTSPATSGRDTRLPAAAVTGFAALPARVHTTMAGLLLAIPDLVALDLPRAGRRGRLPREQGDPRRRLPAVPAGPQAHRHPARQPRR